MGGVFIRFSKRGKNRILKKHSTKTRVCNREKGGDEQGFLENLRGESVKKKH